MFYSTSWSLPRQLLSLSGGAGTAVLGNSDQPLSLSGGADNVHNSAKAANVSALSLSADFQACVHEACAEGGVHEALEHMVNSTVDVHSVRCAQASGPFALGTDHPLGRLGDLGTSCVQPRWAA